MGEVKGVCEMGPLKKDADAERFWNTRADEEDIIACASAYVCAQPWTGYLWKYRPFFRADGVSVSSTPAAE